VRVITTIRLLLAFLASFATGGCAKHYSGGVVDVHGRPVPYARVEGSGMYGGMITAEVVFVVKRSRTRMGVHAHYFATAGDDYRHFPGFETAWTCEPRNFAAARRDCRAMKREASLGFFI
jgi:hypothetical protein